MKWSAFFQKKESVALVWARLYLPLSVNVTEREKSKRERKRQAMSEQEKEVVKAPHCFRYYPTQ